MRFLKQKLSILLGHINRSPDHPASQSIIARCDYDEDDILVCGTYAVLLDENSSVGNRREAAQTLAPGLVWAVLVGKDESEQPSSELNAFMQSLQPLFVEAILSAANEDIPRRFAISIQEEDGSDRLHIYKRKPRRDDRVSDPSDDPLGFVILWLIGRSVEIVRKMKSPQSWLPEIIRRQGRPEDTLSYTKEEFHDKCRKAMSVLDEDNCTNERMAEETSIPLSTYKRHKDRYGLPKSQHTT